MPEIDKPGWKIYGPGTNKEEELLFWTAQAAGIKVGVRTGAHMDKNSHPHIAYNASNNLIFRSRLLSGKWASHKVYTFSEITSLLQEKIKNNEKV